MNLRSFSHLPSSTKFLERDLNLHATPLISQAGADCLSQVLVSLTPPSGPPPSSPVNTLDPLIQRFSSFWKFLQGTFITQALLPVCLCPLSHHPVIILKGFSFPPHLFNVESPQLPSLGTFSSNSVLFTPMAVSSSGRFSGPTHCFSCWLCPLGSLYFLPSTWTSPTSSGGWLLCLSIPHWVLSFLTAEKMFLSVRVLRT